VPTPARITRRQLRPHFAKVDPRLAKLIELAGPFTLQPSPQVSPFRHLTEAIVAQQISLAAARSVTQRLRVTLGYAAADTDPFPSPQDVLAANQAQLRSAGLSRAKAAALHDLAHKTMQGIVPASGILASLSDAAIIERLTQVRGVGPWTVQMMLMFQLGRRDVLPSADFGVRLGFKLLYRKRAIPTPKEIERYGARWAPYRSAASWYLWRAVDRSRAGLPLPGQPR